MTSLLSMKRLLFNLLYTHLSSYRYSSFCQKRIWDFIQTFRHSIKLCTEVWFRFCKLHFSRMEWEIRQFFYKGRGNILQLFTIFKLLGQIIIFTYLWNVLHTSKTNRIVKYGVLQMSGNVKIPSYLTYIRQTTFS